MFNNQARARVPSPAALRALYQLAYISSGTAVGVATLCAEERRRRALILQRIADNAKLIRQSPRHVHNATLAVAEDLQDRSMYDGDTNEYNGNMRRYVVSEGAVRGSELPSIVEKGYKQVTSKGGQKTQRWNIHQVKKRRDTLDDPSRAVSGMLDTPPAHNSVLLEDTRRSNRSDETFGNTFRLNPCLQSNFKPILQQDSTDFVEHVKSEVNRFMKHVSWTKIKEDQPGSGAAQVLLERALECGAFAQVNSISTLKYDNQQWSAHHLQQVVAACPNFAGFQDKEEVLEFYATLVRSDLFRVVSISAQINHAFTLVTEVLSWRSSISDGKVIDALIGHLIENHSKTAATYVQLIQLCGNLLAESQVNAAAYMVISILRSMYMSGSGIDNLHLSEPIEMAFSLADHVFDAAYQAELVYACTKVLKWQCNRRLKREGTLSRYQQFIHLCEKQHLYENLRFITHVSKKSNWLDWLIRGIDPFARTILATACMEDVIFPREAFTRLCRAIPQHFWDAKIKVGKTLQSQTVLTSPKDRMAAQDWEAVRDFSKELSNVRSQTGIDRGTMIVERALRTVQPDEVFNIIRSLGLSGVGRCHMICFVAVAMAKKKSWDKVNQLLNDLSERTDFDLDVLATRQLHQLVHLFSQHHSGQDTWAFTTSLVDRFGLKPTKAITTSLLKCFITSKSLNLIPSWMEYLCTIGIKFDMNASAATELLEKFFFTQKPNHTFIMQLCRDLVRRAPWLSEFPATNLMKKSIAFDMRKAHGRNKVMIRDLTERSLASLADWQCNKPVFKKRQYTERIDVDQRAEKLDFQKSQYSGLSEIDRANLVKPSTFVQRLYPESSWLDQDPDGPRDVELDMVVAFSQGNHRRVSELYRQSLDTMSTPLLPRTLEIAVESSLRNWRGDASEAEGILSKAEKAGIDIGYAMGPILLHRMYHLAPEGKRASEWLYATAMAYSRSCDENGRPVRHFVGVTAANILIDNKRPLEGVHLLKTLDRSKWAKQQSFDIVPMTVYVKGYAALKSIEGLLSVVQRVLKDQIRIDRRFTDALSESLSRFDQVLEYDLIQQIRGLRQQCLMRRKEQQLEAQAIGNELVDQIVRLSRC